MTDWQGRVRESADGLRERPERDEPRPAAGRTGGESNPDKVTSERDSDDSDTKH